MNPKGLLQEFKAFVLRGNVIDLAVAVVIGAAFGAVVNALVTIIPADPVTHHRVWTADRQLMLLALVASAVGVVLTAVPLLGH